uniref:Uncharacterized protein n=1 Tax=Salix viminalis TaxID=40686 RepID=A0A6N2ME24_SALVM
MRKTNTKGNTPLHDAVIKGNRDLAIFASKDLEVAYYNNKNGRSPLYLAVEKGNKNGILDDLLKSGASIPIKREDGNALTKGKSPVHAAIEQHILEKIEKAKPELLCLTDEELGNSLHYASSIGFLEGVQFLLNKFLNGAYERNSEGNYTIHIACENDSVDVVNEFLKSTPFPKEFLNYKGQNILHVAAENGKDRVVRYILRQKTLVESLVNEMDEDGNTPFHLATHRGQSVAAFVLVCDKCVDNSILVSPCGNTLLHVAVSYGSAKIIAYLAEEFPSLITRRNSQNDTVLHLAARVTSPIHTVKFLVESNPSLMRMANTMGNTPLHDAVINGNEEIARLLVSKDPGVANYSNKNGRSPLYLAVENGKKNGILDDLLALGAAIPIQQEKMVILYLKESPLFMQPSSNKIEKAKSGLLCLTDDELGNSLHYASSIGFLEGVQFLLDKFLNGAYERNSEGNYPIHLACKNDSDDLVKEFLKITPFPKEFLNKKGQNILHVAAESGKGYVVRYILEQDKTLVGSLLNEMDEDGNTPLHLAALQGQSMAAFVLVHDKRVENSIVNNENLTPYDAI